ncbi:MAG: hypothetical protein IPK96_18525 [Flammeovirgaceae bacterium]|nr:hypothetical protein [Flammeovirgaceae bacterium]
MEGSILSGGSDGSHVVGPVEMQGLGKWIFLLEMGLPICRLKYRQVQMQLIMQL